MCDGECAGAHRKVLAQKRKHTAREREREKESRNRTALALGRTRVKEGGGPQKKI